jgi:hypothetical protein
MYSHLTRLELSDCIVLYFSNLLDFPCFKLTEAASSMQVVLHEV